MTKIVVSPETVAHLWANQVQQEAKNSNRSFYFYGPSIYSYGSHFEIARHVTNKKGEKAVLFTTRSYSVITAKHISIVSSACSHLNKIYIPAKNFDTYKGEDNFYCWISQLDGQFKLLAKARKKEVYIAAIQRIINQVEVYCNFTGLKPPAELKKLMKASNSEEFNSYLASKSKLIAAREKAKKVKEAKKLAQDLIDWRKFEIQRLYTNYSGFDYLRYNSEKKRIETSQGVEVPVQIAKEFYIYVLSIINGAGACTDCNKQLLHYNVTSIDKNQIKIGCHTIKIDECNLIAKQLKWIE